MSATRSALIVTTGLRRGKAPGDRLRTRVVDPDDGCVRPRDEPLLDGRVVLHRSVPIEMIGRKIEENADRRRERRRKVDLERRAFDHVDPVVGGRLER